MAWEGSLCWWSVTLNSFYPREYTFLDSLMQPWGIYAYVTLRYFLNKTEYLTNNWDQRQTRIFENIHKRIRNIQQLGKHSASRNFSKIVENSEMNKMGRSKSRQVISDSSPILQSLFEIFLNQKMTSALKFQEFYTKIAYKLHINNQKLHCHM